MNSYEQWLTEEKEWISEYQKKIMTRYFLQMVPFTLVVLCALFGAVTYMDGGSLLSGIGAGLAMGIFVSVIYLLFLIAGLRPGRYVKMVQKAVKQLGMEDWEKERLGQEMLEAKEGSWRYFSYVINGHGSSQTPARFRITPHYAFLEGSYPYAILVRLADVEKMLPGEEQKTRTERRAKSRVYESFTLYTLYFYKKGSQSAEKQPDYGMGFFEREKRDRVMELVRKQFAENQEDI